MLIYFWSERRKQSDVKRELAIRSNHSITDWYKTIRLVCSVHLIKHPFQLDGNVIEIDESNFRKKAKNHVGNAYSIPNKWVFGGISRTTGKFFLKFVERRDSNTLIPLIKQYISVGSTICSDEWRAYRQISTLEGYNYIHMTVNHSVNFVDPISGAHTNTIEGCWGCIKSWMKPMKGKFFDILC